MTQADRADVFRGLAHPLRRAVLAQLSRGPCTVGELLGVSGSGAAGTPGGRGGSGIAGARGVPGVAGVAMPTLSRHLAVLRDAGLVRQRKQGHQRIYRLNKPALQKAAKWFKQID